MTPDVPEWLSAALGSTLHETSLQGQGALYRGKVRDVYRRDGEVLLVATDRLSAFDRVIATIPYKGQVLNQLAGWWFAQTADLVGSHVIDFPDPNVTRGREAQALPVEVVVRGYITGVTDTALWTLYAAGVERPYGLDLPSGLRKNDRLPRPVITPTTKGEAGQHDERLTSEEVVSRGLVDAALWAKVCDAALAVFARGQALAAKAGLLLVDTKYEFGLIDGQLCLIDEIHTPDSSRFWFADSYEAAHAAGQEPESLDKEFVRRWLKSVGYGGEGPVPEMPDDIRLELARRYLRTYETLTGTSFSPAPWPTEPRIAAALAGGVS